jgi:hypothetical protein
MDEKDIEVLKQLVSEERLEVIKSLATFTARVTELLAGHEGRKDDGRAKT